MVDEIEIPVLRQKKNERRHKVPVSGTTKKDGYYSSCGYNKDK